MSQPTRNGLRILGGQYRISEKCVLGEGSFATVYKGIDSVSGATVAIKVYKTTDDNALQQFLRTVNVWKHITERVDAFQLADDSKGAWGRKTSCDNQAIMQEVRRNLGIVCDDKTFHELVACMDVRRCFVQLLDYSKDEDFEPGMEAETGELWIVQELGGHTLEDEILERSEKSEPMQASALLDLAWSLVCLTWGLHMCGFVHMDIKPMNIVKFTSEDMDEGTGAAQVMWKLIDLDGAMLAQDTVCRDSGKYCFTPVFMPPELARMIYEQTPTIRASRLMDVWSVGMCIMEAIFGVPVLEPWYLQWGEQTGSDQKFYQWLGDYQTEPIIHGDMEKHLRDLHPGLNKILKNMLRKDPAHRFCAARCIMHATFRPYRSNLLKADGAIQEWMETRKSDLAMNDYMSVEEKRERRSSKACSIM